jgi:hypothetical protein
MPVGVTRDSSFQQGTARKVASQRRGTVKGDDRLADAPKSKLKPKENLLVWKIVSILGNYEGPQFFN